MCDRSTLSPTTVVRTAAVMAGETSIKGRALAQDQQPNPLFRHWFVQFGFALVGHRGSAASMPSYVYMYMATMADALAGTVKA